MSWFYYSIYRMLHDWSSEKSIGNAQDLSVARRVASRGAVLTAVHFGCWSLMVVNIVFNMLSYDLPIPVEMVAGWYAFFACMRLTTVAGVLCLLLRSAKRGRLLHEV